MPDFENDLAESDRANKSTIGFRLRYILAPVADSLGLSDPTRRDGAPYVSRYVCTTYDSLGIN